MDFSTVQNCLVEENKTEEDEGNVQLPGQTEDNDYDQDVHVDAEGASGHITPKTHRLELNEIQASSETDEGCYCDGVLPFVLDENIDYNNVVLTLKCTIQLTNGCCSDEVVPFVLDEDFDYDNVVLTPKFTIQELEALQK